MTCLQNTAFYLAFWTSMCFKIFVQGIKRKTFECTQAQSLATSYLDRKSVCVVNCHCPALMCIQDVCNRPRNEASSQAITYVLIRWCSPLSIKHMAVAEHRPDKDKQLTAHTCKACQSWASCHTHTDSYNLVQLNFHWQKYRKKMNPTVTRHVWLSQLSLPEQGTKWKQDKEHGN